MGSIFANCLQVEQKIASTYPYTPPFGLCLAVSGPPHILRNIHNNFPCHLLSLTAPSIPHRNLSITSVGWKILNLGKWRVPVLCSSLIRSVSPLPARKRDDHRLYRASGTILSGKRSRGRQGSCRFSQRHRGGRHTHSYGT